MPPRSRDAARKARSRQADHRCDHASPAEQALPWHEYRALFMTERRVAARRRVLLATRGRGARRRRPRAGVPRRDCSRIIGVETFFGQITGKYRVLDALATLAFDYPPRGEVLPRRARAVPAADARGSRSTRSHRSAPTRAPWARAVHAVELSQLRGRRRRRRPARPVERLGRRASRASRTTSRNGWKRRRAGHGAPPTCRTRDLAGLPDDSKLVADRDRAVRCAERGVRFETQPAAETRRRC